MNLNFDMIASPNYFYGLYWGSSAIDPLIRNGSTRIQNVFEEYFDMRNVIYELTEFTGRSDYGPFLDYGIPAGGLFTGAEVIKTWEQRDKFGGMADLAYDPCYHQACDTVANINWEALNVMAKTAAYVTEKFARQ